MTVDSAGEATMTSTFPPILRPKPRRPFLTTKLSPAPQPPSPSLRAAPSDDDETPSRTHSILNLTSSTLLGIYSATGYQNEREDGLSTWGTDPETPMEYPSPASPLDTATRLHPQRRSSESMSSSTGTTLTFFLLTLRVSLLFCIGMLYGLLVRHLHDDRQLAPFQVEGILKPRQGWGYLVFWGVSGVALGSLLPWIDGLWKSFEMRAESEEQHKLTRQGTADGQDTSETFGPDWTPVVRSVGAFVGISYAIRKLPWTSTLQASLTLFLVNPVLWYMIDRSKPGFLLSSLVGAVGTTLLMISNPAMMPSPKPALHHTGFSFRNMSVENDGMVGLSHYLSRESIEAGIWILSVLFCSCVCFGNIGRRLALNPGPVARERGRQKERDKDILEAAKIFLEEASRLKGKR